MTFDIGRREFLAGLGGSTAAWPLTARAQPREQPVIALINGGSTDALAGFVVAFRKGLGETGYADGRNVTVEYHWLNGESHRAPALMADLVRRRVAVIATPLSMSAALAAKAATATIPIVFGLSQDPAKFGLVESFPRPGGNATGISFLNRELDGKRLELLHQLVPKAVRIGLLINPASAPANNETTTQNLQEASRGLGLQIHVIHAATSDEIDSAFATLARDRLDALFVAAEVLFYARRVQLATLAARDRIAVSYPGRQMVEAGGLMSYGSDIGDVYHQVGVYTGRILKGAKPDELPVIRPTKFVFAINMKTARQLGIDVPRTLLAFADEVIE